LVQLADLLVEHALTKGDRVIDRFEDVLRQLANNVKNAKRFMRLREFFERTISESEREAFRQEFDQSASHASAVITTLFFHYELGLRL
jgi:hypothetical protein